MAPTTRAMSRKVTKLPTKVASPRPAGNRVSKRTPKIKTASALGAENWSFDFPQDTSRRGKQGAADEKGKGEDPQNGGKSNPSGLSGKLTVKAPDKEPMECSLCYLEITANDDAIACRHSLRRGKHSFHKECMEEWVGCLHCRGTFCRIPDRTYNDEDEGGDLRRTNNATCPVCRRQWFWHAVGDIGEFSGRRSQGNPGFTMRNILGRVYTFPASRAYCTHPSRSARLRADFANIPNRAEWTSARYDFREFWIGRRRPLDEGIMDTADRSAILVDHMRRPNLVLAC